jgi:hypothetical protein
MAIPNPDLSLTSIYINDPSEELSTDIAPGKLQPAARQELPILIDVLSEPFLQPQPSALRRRFCIKPWPFAFGNETISILSLLGSTLPPAIASAESWQQIVERPGIVVSVPKRLAWHPSHRTGKSAIE